jgi:hypothetical protein
LDQLHLFPSEEEGKFKLHATRDICDGLRQRVGMHC